MNTNPPLISIAPMLDWSDRHYRYFMRQISQKVILYSEMIVADAILHGHRDRLLSFNPLEQKLVLQLGGSDPKKLYQASAIAASYGYTELNLNCGCPSPRVQSGNFGACLMEDPLLVADCVRAMQDGGGVPVTIKQRIGLDYNYDYSLLTKFVDLVAEAGCTTFIVHARNAVLHGLSPKDNREVPPLRYDFVYRLKADFPQLNIILNGGIKTTSTIHEHLNQVDGVMLGREAYHNPYICADFDQEFYQLAPQVCLSRTEVALAMLPYLERHVANGGRIHHVLRHMLGLFHGAKGAKLWRQELSRQMHAPSTKWREDYLKLLMDLEEQQEHSGNKNNVTAT